MYTRINNEIVKELDLEEGYKKKRSCLVCGDPVKEESCPSEYQIIHFSGANARAGDNPNELISVLHEDCLIKLVKELR